MFPFAFNRSKEQPLTWVSDQIHNENIGNTRDEVSLIMYKNGIKGTLSTIYGKGFFQVKIRFDNEGDETFFIMYIAQPGKQTEAMEVV